MRVLLGLGDAQLLQALRRDVLAEAVRDALRRERRREVREVLAVARERAEVAELRDARAREAVEIGIGQRARQLRARGRRGNS